MNTNQIQHRHWHRGPATGSYSASFGVEDCRMTFPMSWVKAVGGVSPRGLSLVGSDRMVDHSVDDNRIGSRCNRWSMGFNRR